MSKGFSIERSLLHARRQEGGSRKRDRRQTELKQNERLVVVLKVEAPETGGRILLVDRLPAGLEIENPRLVDSGDIKTPRLAEDHGASPSTPTSATTASLPPSTSSARAADGAAANGDSDEASRGRSSGHGRLSGARGDARLVRASGGDGRGHVPPRPLRAHRLRSPRGHGQGLATCNPSAQHAAHLPLLAASERALRGFPCSCADILPVGALVSLDVLELSFLVAHGLKPVPFERDASSWRHDPPGRQLASSQFARAPAAQSERFGSRSGHRAQSRAWAPRAPCSPAIAGSGWPLAGARRVPLSVTVLDRNDRLLARLHDAPMVAGGCPSTPKEVDRALSRHADRLRGQALPLTPRRRPWAIGRAAWQLVAPSPHRLGRLDADHAGGAPAAGRARAHRRRQAAAGAARAAARAHALQRRDPAASTCAWRRSAATWRACAPPRSPISARSRGGCRWPRRPCWWRCRSRRSCAAPTASREAAQRARNRVLAHAAAQPASISAARRDARHGRAHADRAARIPDAGPASGRRRGRAATRRASCTG